MDYSLDANAAKQADNLNSRIEHTGKYFGIFTRAEKVVANSGAKGIEFSFKADDGATADYLTIYTHNGSGGEIYGYNQLMAIMTCLRIKGLSVETGEVEKYDSEQKKRVKVSAELFKELMGKPIGITVQMEQYAKRDGSTAWKPSISAPFDKDGFTASEILNKATKPELLENMVARLRDKPLKGATATSQPSSNASGAYPADDDIPFLCLGHGKAWSVI